MRTKCWSLFEYEITSKLISKSDSPYSLLIVCLKYTMCFSQLFIYVIFIWSSSNPNLSHIIQTVCNTFDRFSLLRASKHVRACALWDDAPPLLDLISLPNSSIKSSPCFSMSSLTCWMTWSLTSSDNDGIGQTCCASVVNTFSRANIARWTDSSCFDPLTNSIALKYHQVSQSIDWL